MTLQDDLKNEQQAQNETDLVRLRRQRDSFANQNARLTTQLEAVERCLQIVERAEGTAISPPAWLVPAKPKRSAATLVVILSDTHFDEVVKFLESNSDGFPHRFRIVGNEVVIEAPA